MRQKWEKRSGTGERKVGLGKEVISKDSDNVLLGKI